MHELSRRALLLGVSGTLALAPLSAHAGTVAGFGGATEITQLLNYAQLVASYAKQAESVVQQVREVALTLQQYETMLKNTLRLPQQVWSDVQGELQDLASIVREGRSLALSLSSIDAEFAARFPGYSAHAARAAGGGGDLQGQFADWFDTTSDALRGALKAGAMQEEQFASEEATMRQLKAMASSAEGQMQALEIGNMIAGEMVGQMQKLRALAAAQSQGALTFYAARNDEAAAKRAATEEFLRPRQGGTIVGDGKRY